VVLVGRGAPTRLRDLLVELPGAELELHRADGEAPLRPLVAHRQQAPVMRERERIGHLGREQVELDVTRRSPRSASAFQLAWRRATALKSSVLIPVLANDSDADGDSLTITSVTQPSRGSASIRSNQILFTPGNGFSGSVTFNYAISDGPGGSASATVTVAKGK
jgi:hypothetical protein